MSDPTFGISITRIDNEPRPAVYSDMSVVGLIGTAPEADPAVFPLDTPVFLYSDDAAKRTALGTRRHHLRRADPDQCPAGRVPGRGQGRGGARGGGRDASRRPSPTSWATASPPGSRPSCRRGRCSASSRGSSARRASPASGRGRMPMRCARRLPAICNKLLAHAVVDGPATTEQAAIDWRETISSSRLIPVDPAVRVMAGSEVAVMPLSPAVIGIGVRRDHEKQGRPFHSWANQPVAGHRRARRGRSTSR